jgi:hypothetical protein
MAFTGAFELPPRTVSANWCIHFSGTALVLTLGVIFRFGVRKPKTPGLSLVFVGSRPFGFRCAVRMGKIDERAVIPSSHYLLFSRGVDCELGFTGSLLLNV